MRKSTQKVAIALLTLGAWLVPAGQAQAATEAKPAWQLSLVPLPTNFVPGASGTTSVGPMYRLVATNIGGKATTGAITLKVTLPAGIAPFGKPAGDTSPIEPGPVTPACEAVGQVVTCTVSEPTYPGRWIGARIPVKVSGALLPKEVLTATASVEGGGADPMSTSYETEIEAKAPPFGFLPGAAGLSTVFTDADGSAATEAGSHPDQLTINIGFPIAEPATGTLTGAGHPRTVITELPRGLVGNPTATPKRCTEAELISGGPGEASCPIASQVGTITAMTIESLPVLPPVALYNMVPPPGVPAEFAFNALNYDIFVHLDAEVRSDGDFGVSARTDDIIARTGNPIMSVQAQLWGDPSSTSHDEIRSFCSVKHHQLCPPAERRNAPFLTMPSACSGPLQTTVKARSWEEPGTFHERSALSTDVFGNPVGVTGCSTLDFKPTLTLRPETSAADTPTGVHIDLNLPQNEKLRDDKSGEPQRATANLRDTTLTLPEGMAVNPAAASGLQACSPDQIGLKTAVGQTPIRFNSERPNCPLGAKVGTVEVKTPLLDHPVPGAVYVAAPYENPFGTLLGVYVVIDDPADGIVVKLAGKTEADPETGQLTTSFTEAPELPFEDFRVNLKGGSRAILRTPSACGTYATESVHTPWSGTTPVHATDSFAINGGAGGSPCAASEAQLPNSPGFEAGTETPLAGAYSPFLSRLERADGTQLMKSIELTLPEGLVGRLAGTSICSDAALATAAARTGRQEQASPSCPGSSLLGGVKVGAGAGPTPFYTAANVYLAGPYRGAPLSFAVIAPAVAGPFDLGTVVVRVAARLDPETTKVSVQSDPFPHILEGIPLDVRDVRIKMDRERFILNPTSCAPKAFTGSEFSLLGASAPLSERFQVGGCRALGFEPRLTLNLRGGTTRGSHPSLRAVGSSKEGEANLASASVALPHSEFLDQAHIRTVCTRVQFAASNCPDGAIYGHIEARTPLLDETLSGPVYLRSSSHKLPDMVAVLKGPPSRPLEIDVVGRIDSVNGGIRTRIESVPDAPVSQFVLSLPGGRKGLLINSRNLCTSTNRATVKLNGQNGKTHDFHPLLRTTCKQPKG